jgi:hypothetical protein
MQEVVKLVEAVICDVHLNVLLPLLLVGVHEVFLV